jgi:hypothetical protein
LAGGLGHQRLDLQGAEVGEQQEQADRHRRIADARDQERFERGAGVRRIAIPETDQQVAAQSHALPTEVEQQQVVGQHQHQHGGDKEVHRGEEARVVGVAGHVFRRVEMDQEADEGNDERHQKR